MLLVFHVFISDAGYFNINLKVFMYQLGRYEYSFLVYYYC